MSKHSSKANVWRGPMIVIMLLAVASLACTISTHQSALSSSESIDTLSALSTVTPVGTYCQLHNFMAQGVMSALDAQGMPIYQLGPDARSTVLAITSGGGMYKIDTPAGPGWTNGVENVELLGDCKQLPVEDPADSAQ